jgi:hypothetical protein
MQGQASVQRARPKKAEVKIIEKTKPRIEEDSCRCGKWCWCKGKCKCWLCTIIIAILVILIGAAIWWFIK